jgi:hypothetical protein
MLVLAVLGVLNMVVAAIQLVGIMMGRDIKVCDN